MLEEAMMKVFDVGIRSSMEDGLVQTLKLAIGCCVSGNFSVRDRR